MSEQLQDASKGPLPWWVRFCRWLKARLLYVWGTLFVGILVSTIANLNTTTTDTPLSRLFLVHLALTFPIPVFAGLGVLLLLTLLTWVGSRERDVAMPLTLSEQNRAHMLRRLRLRYEQMLAQSLQGAVQIELGLASRPAAVQNAASLSLRLPDQPEHVLPPQTTIREAYELAQHELLILGEPGTGKSTFLLELAHHLVEQAEQDATQPLPVLVPLSSWAINRRPLQEWLIEQVALLYDVPRKLSQQWIQAGLILPLLDGLDEMDESARAACIVAINTYHHDHLQPLVVCSRTNEYEMAAKSERLALHTAVVVQPLSMQQVDSHLENLGKPLAALRSALKRNATLQELATTPLMLQVLMLTYHGTRVRELPHKETQLRQQIWTDYVQRMVNRKGNAKHYPLHVTALWLSFLARQMRAHNQTIFFLEQIPPDWLPKWQEWLYRLSVLLGVLLVSVLFGVLFGGPFGVLVYIPFGEPFWPFSPVGIAMLSVGLVSALFGGLGFVLPKKIELTEVLTWSWKNLRTNLFGGLVGMLFGGPLGVLFGLLFVTLLSNSPVLTRTGSVWSSVLGGILGIVLFGGLSKGQLTERLMLSPNEGIKRSAENGLTVGRGIVLFCMLFFGLFFGLTSYPTFVLVFRYQGPQLLFKLLLEFLAGLFFGLFFGLLVGFLFGLLFGLGTAIQHYILRFWLANSHLFPWKVVRFLEDATARILLRRVGGGYRFTHRLLLEYFADLNAPPSPPTGIPPAQPTPPP